MVEYNNSYAGQGYAVQPGSVPPVDPITPGVPLVDPQKAQKKQKTSRILGFIAMGLAIISIPMFFLPLVSAFGLADVSILNLTKIADFIGMFVEVKMAVILIGVYLGAIILLSVVGSVFDIFKNKGCKLVAAITKAVAMIMSIVAIILVFVKGENMIKPGIGLYMNAVLLLISFVLSLVAAIIMPKANAEIVGPDPSIIGVPPIIGDDRVIPPETALLQGRIVFTSGCCAGYDIPIKPGTRIVIGKDPSQCSIIIDKSYAKVSRTHCSVEYDSYNNVYVVTDMSTNGTKIVGGPKLQRGTPSYLDRGTVINLAGTDNTFRLD